MRIALDYYFILYGSFSMVPLKENKRGNQRNGALTAPSHSSFPLHRTKPEPLGTIEP